MYIENLLYFAIVDDIVGMNDKQKVKCPLLAFQEKKLYICRL